MQQMAYLIVIGGFCLICAAVLLAAWRKNALLEQRDAWEALACMGMKRRDLGKLFAVQGVLIALTGVVTGVIVSLALPSFLSTGEATDTNFMLAVPFVVAAGSGLVCIAAGIAPMLGRRGQDER